MKRNAVLYIAMSLDGFIADKDGGVAWLEDGSPDIQENENYCEFIKTVDTIVMGYTTYHQIITELSPAKWPYKGMDTYILTHRKAEPKAGIHFVNEEIEKFIEDLKGKAGKNIWICGGADIVNQLIPGDLIDRYHITIMPCLLGRGIKLFKEKNQVTKLKLQTVKPYGDLVDLIYERQE